MKYTFFRHWPKTHLSWPLSEDGKNFVLNRFLLLTKEIDNQIAAVYHSPIHRTTETAELLLKALELNNKETPMMEEEKRLSEWGIAHHKEISIALGWLWWNRVKWRIDSEDWKNKPEYENLKTWKEVIMWFCDWILETMQKDEKNIYAFTHAPVMLWFLYLVQAETGFDILPESRDTKSIFKSELDYLSSFSLDFSENQESFDLEFNWKSTSIDIKIIESISKTLHGSVDKLKNSV